MTDRRRTWRRVVLLGVPALYLVLGLLHPTANPELGDDTDLFIYLHLIQLRAHRGARLRAVVPGRGDREPGRQRRASAASFPSWSPTRLSTRSSASPGGSPPKRRTRAAGRRPAGSGCAHRGADLRRRRPTRVHPLLRGGSALAGRRGRGRRGLRDTAPVPALVLMSLGALVFTLGMPLRWARSAWLCSWPELPGSSSDQPSRESAEVTIPIPARPGPCDSVHANSGCGAAW